jgi:putative ABC transport system permease protein
MNRKRDAGHSSAHVLTYSRWRASWWLWARCSARRLTSNPQRLAIVLISVALATALASAVLRVSVASIDSFERSISGGDRPYHVLISPVGGRLNRDAIAPCLTALSSRADLLGIRREAGVVRRGAIKLPVRVAGLAALSRGTGEVEPAVRVITPDVAQKLGVADAATVTLEVGEQVIELPVQRAGNSRTIAGYADLVVALTDLPQGAALDSVALRLRGSQSPDETESAARGFEQWIASCLASGPPIRVEPVSAPIERGAQLLGAYRFNIFVMTLITLLVCGILISQATQIAVYGVVRELAIVRTLGVSQRECLMMVVAEATVISFVGSLIGVTVAAPLVVWVAGFLTSTASEIYNVSLQTGSGATAWGTLVALLAMTLLGAGSACIGARSVAGIAPYRGTRREYRAVRPLQASVVVVASMLASSTLGGLVLLLVLQPTASVAYGVVGVVLVWAAAFVTLLLHIVPHVAWGVRRYLAVRLARGTLQTSARSFVLSGVAATVAISLLVGLALMVGSFRETLARWSAVRLAGDIFVSSAVSGAGNEGRLPPQLVGQIAELPGVKRVIPYFETAARIGDWSLVVGGVDLHIQCERRVYSFISGQCLPPQTPWSGQAIASESAARKLGIQMGSEVTIDGGRFTVRGTFQEFGTEQPLIVVDRRDFESRYRDHHPETITVDLHNVEDLVSTQAQVQGLAPVTTTVRDQRELLALVETLFNRTFRVTDSVRAIVFVMALLGLLSTTAQYIWERRRELRVAYVVGVSRRQLVAALTIEAVVVAGLAAVGGTIAGVMIGWCLTSYVNPLVFGWSLSFSVSLWPIGEAFFFVVCVGAAMVLVAQIMVSRIATSVSLADE